MVWPILPSLQACPGSNSWSFSGWSLSPVSHSQPSLSIRLCPPRGSHWPPSAGRQGPGHPDSAPAGWGAPPTAPPRSGGCPGPLCRVPQSCWSLGSRRGLAGRQGSVQVQGSARTTQVGSGHRAGTAVGAARGSLERGRLAGLGLGPGDGVEVDAGLRLHHDHGGARGHEAHVGAVCRPDLSEAPVSVGVLQLLAGQPARGRRLGHSAGCEGLRLPRLWLRRLAGTQWGPLQPEKRGVGMPFLQVLESATSRAAGNEWAGGRKGIWGAGWGCPEGS